MLILDSLEQVEILGDADWIVFPWTTAESQGSSPGGTSVFLAATCTAWLETDEE